MKYTKGEWITEYEKREKGYFVRNILEDGSGESIAFVYLADEKCARVNAHLISAAPKMYEALHTLYLECLKLTTMPTEASRKAVKALAKANINFRGKA